MVKTKTVPFKRFSTKNGKNQKAESPKMEGSHSHHYSHFNQKTNSNQKSNSNSNQNSIPKFNQNSNPKFNTNCMTNLEVLPQTPKTTIVVVDLVQLAEMMQGIVKAELANHKSPQQIPSEEELLNASETIAFLRVSRPTYQKLRREGEIKAVAISERRILYRKSDLLSYVNSKVN